MVQQIKSDYRQATVDARTRALLDYAVAVTRDVHQVNRATIDGLRAHGLTDADILDATQIIGLFNYYNRLVDALGVEPEDFMLESARR